MIDQFCGEYHFLSCAYEHLLTWRGMPCRSALHAFQASKTTDLATAYAIATAETSRAAKTAGRLLPLRADWERIKLDVMRSILVTKFAPGEELAGRLLATGDQLLVAGNTSGDTFWGVCDRTGANWLGHLLMARRAELRAGQPDTTLTKITELITGEIRDAYDEDADTRLREVAETLGLAVERSDLTGKLARIRQPYGR